MRCVETAHVRRNDDSRIAPCIRRPIQAFPSFKILIEAGQSHRAHEKPLRPARKVF